MSIVSGDGFLFCSYLDIAKDSYSDRSAHEYIQCIIIIIIIIIIRFNHFKLYWVPAVGRSNLLHLTNFNQQCFQNVCLRHVMELV